MRFRQVKNLTLGGRRFRGNHMSLMNKYPRLTDLEAPAARRIPKFVFAYLDSGTGQDQAKDHNRAYLDGIELTPQFMRGRVNPDLTTKLFGHSYNAPFRGGADWPVIADLAGGGIDFRCGCQGAWLSLYFEHSCWRVAGDGGQSRWRDGPGFSSTHLKTGR